MELPEVLCIHLKRFRYDAYISTNKISRHIRFPLTGLSMGPFLKHSGTAGGSQGNAGGSHVYNLDAVITHYGGAGGMNECGTCVHTYVVSPLGTKCSGTCVWWRPLAAIQRWPEYTCIVAIPLV